MPDSLITHAFGHAAGRIPGLRRLPVMKLLALGEILVLARDHVGKLEPRDRRRLVELLRRGHGRPQNLSASERDELSMLILKAEPRLFAGIAAQKLSPVPLPRRVVRGPRKRKR